MNGFLEGGRVPGSPGISLMKRGQTDFAETHPRMKQYNLFQKASTSIGASNGQLLLPRVWWKHGGGHLLVQMVGMPCLLPAEGGDVAPSSSPLPPSQTLGPQLRGLASFFFFFPLMGKQSGK